MTTFVEQAYGTDFVERNIYHTCWFCCLWGTIATIALVALIRRALWRRFPILLFHGSLLVILVGAMITFIGSKKGYVHLLPGATIDSFLESESGRKADLPFTIQLDSFRIAYYPGTEAPADYISYITYSLPGQKNVLLHEQISMNRIFTSQGFRFYQSSFDDDGKGSWLTVNYDPWGTGVTYAGYILLGLSMIWLLFSRSSDFRRLLNHPLLKKGGVFILFIFCLAGNMQAQKKLLPALKRTQADSLAQEQVIYHDRVVPFNTLARDFIQKLTGEASYKGLTPEQVIGGWLLYPEVWRNEPLIYIKNTELQHLLNLQTPYARLTDLFDGSVYRLREHWQREQGQQNKLAKAIQETDEKVGLILMLEKGTFIHPLPTDGSVQPLSELEVKAELLYNRIPFSKILFMINLSLGVLSFLLLLHNSLQRNILSPKAKTISRTAGTFFSVALYLAFIFHLAGYGTLHPLDSLSAPSKIFIYTSIRIPPLRLCFVGFLSGTNESPDNPINAGARLSMAKYSCFIDYDVLCPIGIHHAKRNTGIMPPEKRIGKQCLRKRRYTRQPDRTVDASQPLAALPCHLLFRSRHLSGSSLGKRFLGTILGVGPERSMGTDYFSGIWSSLPFTKSAHFPQASILPYLYDSCFPDRLNDLFRGKLCSWRDA